MKINISFNRFASSFGVSLAVTFLFNTVLVMAKGISGDLFNWMVALTGHHWISHSIFVLVVFLALGLWLSIKKTSIKVDLDELPVYTILSAIVSVFIMAGFYLFQ